MDVRIKVGRNTYVLTSRHRTVKAANKEARYMRSLAGVASVIVRKEGKMFGVYTRGKKLR